MRYETRSVLDARSVLVAVVVLLVGAALGFGVGYKYEKHQSAKSHSTTAATSNTSTTVANVAGASKAEKVKNILIACMAAEGVKYPNSSADISKPPPGVSQAKFAAAGKTCAEKLIGK